ncbi:transcriptional regulator [Pseudomonas sp. 10B1]|uniref:helix-turn-helix domain-containing protein n=1 Tax=unclassified Pseudomonas TaxID=196821 RepID=UPI002AB4D398|nr:MULTISPECIES: transcriptional regulator [unclassified Pseudomonas]MDY7559532.1 transcriptional regulator [Pseudomonas sp. AB6]MEA9977559.1 transcriptional regulator [Pseudomonas sp. RTS4]MEA9996386.1 transcriptional regulator [Pseudomonas sp. AA4]MEB0088111.1 transcriptional regulator [Pseudomonas sp. RTI1]MEB0126938.1 transcriptional regulator [Pseudomonas sp. CCC1.2]
MSAALTERIVDGASMRELAQRMETLRLDMDRLGAHFIHHIETEAEYQKALAVIDELTDGQALDAVEQTLLDTLCETVGRYEDHAPQFGAFNAGINALTDIDLIKALMLQNKLSGADLPEIGDKTVVSRILSGHRKLTVEMIARLAARFHVDPGVFVSRSV